MKKFKIIEKSRFLNGKDMSSIKGGVVGPGPGDTCTSTKPYASCDGNGSYITCGLPVAGGGFNIDMCGNTNFPYSLSCGADVNYSTCSNPRRYGTGCPLGWAFN